MLAQLLHRRRRAAAAPPGLFLRQHLDGAVHADREHLVHLGQVRIEPAVPDIGSVAPDSGLDRLAIRRMRSDLARQAEQGQRLFEVHRLARPALGQRGARRLGGRFGRLAALDIGPEAPRFQPDVIATLLAEHPVGAAFRLAVRRRKRPRVAAFGIVRAADEGATRARRLQGQPSVAAGRAGARVGAVLARRKEVRLEHLVDLLQHFGNAQIGGFGQGCGEIPPETRQHVLPVAVAGRDVVELVFQIGGEVVFQIFAEIVGEKRGDEAALVLGNQAALVLRHIFALLDRCDDRGIGRGPADAELLHPLDQRRLGVARRRLREVLFGRDAALLGGLALGDLRQALVVVIGRVVVAAFLVDLHEAVEQHHLAGGAQLDLAVGRADIDGGPLQPRRLHLAGDGALPDQVVELALVGIGDAQRGGVAAHVGRPDAFMRLLGVLRLVLVHPRAGRHVSLAEPRLDLGARRHHRLGRHVDAVGAHIGDVAGLVEALRGAHRLARAHAELAAGLLLQRRGHERRIGVAAGRLGLDRLHRKIARGHRLHGKFGGRRGGDVELVELPAPEHRQPGPVFLAPRRREHRGDAPVFAGPERLDLHLALDDQAQADRLHAARRFRARQLAPQDRREVEADEIVERPARQIGLDQRGIHLARTRHRLGDGGFGDRVEGDAADLLARLEVLGQRLLQVPGDRLALAVGVGGEDQRVVALQRVGDRLDMLAAIRRHLPFHREPVLGIDRAVLGRQVADMAVGGENRVAGAEILVDGAGLGGGFDDDDGHTQLLRRRAPARSRLNVAGGGGCQPGGESRRAAARRQSRKKSRNGAGCSATSTAAASAR